MKRIVLWCSILLLTLAAPIPAQAQGSYPDRPIKFVISFPLGGATDTYFRQITNGLSAALGQPVVVENRGGAGGYIGWMAVDNAEPDGYAEMTRAEPTCSRICFTAVSTYDCIVQVGLQPQIS